MMICGVAAQGNIADWKKKEGDEFAAGDVLAEIETDKVTSYHIIEASLSGASHKTDYYPPTR